MSTGLPRAIAIIRAEDTETLIGLVMKLTGGNANPAVIIGQIERWKARYAEDEKEASGVTTIG